MRGAFTHGASSSASSISEALASIAPQQTVPQERAPDTPRVGSTTASPDAQVSEREPAAVAASADATAETAAPVPPPPRIEMPPITEMLEDIDISFEAILNDADARTPDDGWDAPSLDETPVAPPAAGIAPAASEPAAAPAASATPAPAAAPAPSAPEESAPAASSERVFPTMIAPTKAERKAKASGPTASTPTVPNVPPPSAPSAASKPSRADTKKSAKPRSSRSAEPTGARPEDMVEVRRLFEQIAAEYLRPVRELMIEAKLGEPPKEWVQVCRPAVVSMRRSAEQMGYPELGPPLDAFLAALDRVEALQGPLISEAGRAVLNDAYVPLVGLIPEALALKDERNRREPIIVQSLLRQVPDVRKVALDKIYAAGLTTLQMFFVAKPGDLADATGLEKSLCQRIVDRFRRYKSEVAEARPDVQRSSEHAELRALAARLAEQNDAYDRGSAWHGGADDKRRIRRERSETILQINVVLARLGNVDLVNQLEKLPFGKKVQHLERYLDSVNRAPAPS